MEHIAKKWECLKTNVQNTLLKTHIPLRVRYGPLYESSGTYNGSAKWDAKKLNYADLFLYLHNLLRKTEPPKLLQLSPRHKQAELDVSITQGTVTTQMSPRAAKNVQRIIATYGKTQILDKANMELSFVALCIYVMNKLATPEVLADKKTCNRLIEMLLEVSQRQNQHVVFDLYRAWAATQIMEFATTSTDEADGKSDLGTRLTAEYHILAYSTDAEGHQAPTAAKKASAIASTDTSRLCNLYREASGVMMPARLREQSKAGPVDNFAGTAFFLYVFQTKIEHGIRKEQLSGIGHLSVAALAQLRGSVSVEVPVYASGSYGRNNFDIDEATCTLKQQGQEGPCMRVVLALDAQNTLLVHVAATNTPALTPENTDARVPNPFALLEIETRAICDFYNVLLDRLKNIAGTKQPIVYNIFPDMILPPTFATYARQPFAADTFVRQAQRVFRNLGLLPETYEQRADPDDAFSDELLCSFLNMASDMLFSDDSWEGTVNDQSLSATYTGFGDCEDLSIMNYNAARAFAALQGAESNPWLRALHRKMQKHTPFITAVEVETQRGALISHMICTLVNNTTNQLLILDGTTKTYNHSQAAHAKRTSTPASVAKIDRFAVLAAKIAQIKGLRTQIWKLPRLHNDEMRGFQRRIKHFLHSCHDATSARYADSSRYLRFTLPETDQFEASGVSFADVEARTYALRQLGPPSDALDAALTKIANYIPTPPSTLVTMPDDKYHKTATELAHNLQQTKNAKFTQRPAAKGDAIEIATFTLTILTTAVMESTNDMEKQLIQQQFSDMVDICNYERVSDIHIDVVYIHKTNPVIDVTIVL